MVPLAGPGVWTPSPSAFYSPDPESARAVPTLLTAQRSSSAKLDAAIATTSTTAVSRKTAIIPAAPLPLPPLETIIGYHIPTPSPEPEIFELPRLNPAKRKRPNSHRPSLPRTHRADSDEPVLLSEAPGWLRQPTATPGGSTTSAFIDPSKIVFDPLAQAPPLGATCKIVRYPGKGLGLQATGTIKRGEEVIRETPFITFDHPITGIDLYERRRKLASREQALFLSFTGTVKDEPDRWVNIAETNCIDLWNADDDDGMSSGEPIDMTNEEFIDGVSQRSTGTGCAGLFEFICRINHSCSSNSRWSWDKEAKQLGQ